MNSVYSNYALEGKNKDGTPNGKFVLNQEGAKALAQEVMATNLKWDKKKIEEHTKNFFLKSFCFYDHTEAGILDVSIASQFVRYFTGQEYIQGMNWKFLYNI